MKSVSRVCFISLLLMSLFVTQSLAFELGTDIEDASMAYLGASNYSYTGWSLSSGDVDGLTDLLIGACGGRVYILLGRHLGQRTGGNIESYARENPPTVRSVNQGFRSMLLLSAAHRPQN
jgi:hypothetical protein